MGQSEHFIEIVTSLSGVSKSQWDACADGDGQSNPFVGYDFLYALEGSQSAVSENGWLAQHILLKSSKDQRLLAVAPLYLKTHSYGEYVFDHAFASAYERAGGAYYPKLQSCVPFTPVTGLRLLVRKGEGCKGGEQDSSQGSADQGELDSRGEKQAHYQGLLGRALVEMGHLRQVSSLHVTFCTSEESRHLEKLGFLTRLGYQFHWFNENYDAFDQFLERLTSRKRKAIRKERAIVQKSGVRLEALTGDDIKSHHWDRFYAFYLDTGNRKWGTPYLTRDFFDILHQSFRDKVVLVVGKEAGNLVGPGKGGWIEDEGEIVCGALNFIGKNRLYGRNWGSSVSHKNLHFEACYYQAIEFAIRHNLACVEAGAQGKHKLQRGYEPVFTYSAHYFYDSAFSGMVSNYLEHERCAVIEENGHMEKESPYKSM